MIGLNNELNKIEQVKNSEENSRDGLYRGNPHRIRLREREKTILEVIELVKNRVKKGITYGENNWDLKDLLGDEKW